MFAIQPGLAEGAQILGGLPPAACQPALQPDSNSNFMERIKDANENWHGMPGKAEPILMVRSSPESPSDNQAFQATGLPEGEVRSPPEGAEIPGAESEKSGGAGSLCSPLEDIGYASSSLSIDSLSSPEPASGIPGGPGPPDPLLPSVAQAVRQLQAQERYKEQEKVKHHMHLVMYRRLALLQWIRALQHQLVDQQARLQESFDTILDNRKELIRCLQQRAAPSRPQDQE